MKNNKEFFGKGKENIRNIEWDWENFKDTKEYPVSEKLLDHVIGQDRVLEEVKLALDEWLYKIKCLQEVEWYKQWLNPNTEKTIFNKTLSPAPCLLLLGDAGTGKSLIGKAMAEYLTNLYKEYNIKRFDVLCWKNNIIPSNPKISIHPSGEGKKLITVQTKKVKKSWFRRNFIKVISGALIGVGAIVFGTGIYFLWTLLPIYGLASSIALTTQFLLAGLMAMGSGAMVYIFSNFFNIGGDNQSSQFNIGGATRSSTPKLIVDNSGENVPFIDATGHTSAQLYGSIAWDPYQTGGLGTPEHKRVTAGDVHRANLGILYIDEIKNLNMTEVITLLTVMEDSCLPITIRSSWHGADTAAMAVSTEPIPSLFFLLAAGNFDSIPQIHPALMDRLTGYGKVVRMNNDMENTIENRRKYIQFIVQEIKRFNLLPFNREACIEIIEEARRRSNKRDSLVCKFRPLISVIKTSSTIAQNRHKDIVDREEVIEAVNIHCKTIQKQLQEHYVEEEGKYLEIKPEGKQLGVIYGLSIIHDCMSEEMTGNILRVKAQMIKCKKKETGYFKVTGTAKNATWIDDSIEKVRSVILQKYDVDIATKYYTHIDFSQAYGIDGPSAGVTMTILIASLLQGKPIRQDVAVTGEINISTEDEIEITAVGGIHEKIRAAESWNFKKVVIPKKNYNYSINPKDYKIEVVGCENLDEYLKEVLVE